LREKILAKEYQFGFQQHFSLLNEALEPIESSKAQKIIDGFYKACLFAGINLSGACSGIYPDQFVYEIGPEDGLRVCDDLMTARYLLEKISADFGLGVAVNYEGKLKR
jgi:glutamine synthetase